MSPGEDQRRDYRVQTQELCSNLGFVCVRVGRACTEREIEINTEGTRDGCWEGGHGGAGAEPIRLHYPLRQSRSSCVSPSVFASESACEPADNLLLSPASPGLQHTVEDVHSRPLRSSIPGVLSPVLNTETNGCVIVENYLWPDLAVCAGRPKWLNGKLQPSTLRLDLHAASRHAVSNCCTLPQRACGKGHA